MFATHRAVLAAACVLSLLHAGCYPAARGKALEAKVDRLQGENDALRAELDKTRKDVTATLPKIDEKVAEVTKALDDLDRASRRSDADTGVLLQKTIEDVAALRGQIDTYVHQLTELRAALDRVSADTEQKVLAMMTPEQVKAFDARKKLEELERPKQPGPFLALAQEKAKAGDSLVARRLYDEFLKRWPSDPLVGEAHFGLGELSFNDDKCREALFEYQKVLQSHPKTKSAPEAYLRTSTCFAKLNLNQESRLALEELMKNHPKSAAAKRAKTLLAEMDAKAAPKKAPAPKKGGK